MEKVKKNAQVAQKNRKAAAAMLCTGPVTVTGAESVEKSYPRFWADWEHLKGDTL